MPRLKISTKAAFCLCSFMHRPTQTYSLTRTNMQSGDLVMLQCRPSIDLAGMVLISGHTDGRFVFVFSVRYRTVSTNHPLTSSCVYVAFSSFGSMAIILLDCTDEQSSASLLTAIPTSFTVVFTFC